MTARIIDITGKLRALVAKRPLADQLRASIAVERARKRNRSPEQLLEEFYADAALISDRCCRCGELPLAGGTLDMKTWKITCADCAQKNG